MLRGAARGAFQSARQLRRAAARRASGGGSSGRGRSSHKDAGESLLRDEGAFTGQQRRAFGKAQSDTIPRAVAVGAVDLLSAGGANAVRIAMLEALIEEDDDGR